MRCFHAQVKLEKCSHVQMKFGPCIQHHIVFQDKQLIGMSYTLHNYPFGTPFREAYTSHFGVALISGLWQDIESPHKSEAAF